MSSHCKTKVHRQTLSYFCFSNIWKVSKASGQWQNFNPERSHKRQMTIWAIRSLCIYHEQIKMWGAIILILLQQNFSLSVISGQHKWYLFSPKQVYKNFPLLKKKEEELADALGFFIIHFRNRKGRAMYKYVAMSFRI